ncbi:MAG: molybdopterin-dependent oxidoreductase, partial [Acidobacteria bacterium]|nr:molybdopterin-dependent oxidoreductase [Acidobacteriota bacterium]
FGQKMFPHPEELAVGFATRRLNRPVKWIEDRRENLLCGEHPREDSATISFAVDDDGTFLATKADFLESAGAFPDQPPGRSRLLEVGMIGVKHDRLPLELVLEHVREPVIPPFRHPGDVVNSRFLVGVVIDIEVLRLHDLEVERFPLNLVSAEVLGIGGWRETEHDCDDSHDDTDGQYPIHTRISSLFPVRRDIRERNLERVTRSGRARRLPRPGGEFEFGCTGI